MTSSSSAIQPRLSLKSVWKLYGDGAGALLRDNGGNPPAKLLRDHGIVPAVCNVTLEVFEGECFVIMGLSGSGKSTLVRCMSRLVEPTAGIILFDGEDLLAVSPRRLIEIRRHQMGMVFQHFALLPHLDVLANVAFPLEIQGTTRVEREARAREMIELVGLAGRERFYPRELSGGQQQRVGIARSLAVEPAVWFLDEPFSALDPLIRREMQDEFMRLQFVLKKTIVFITHDFDEAIRVADRIAIMKDGTVVQIGSPEEIVMAPADDYVAEFTRNVSRSKVVRVGALMKSAEDPSGDFEWGADIRVDARIAEAAPAFAGSRRPLRVCDTQDRTVGRLDFDDVVRLVMQG